jgi:hypothetical protein
VCSVGYMAEHGSHETLRFWVHSCFQHAMNLSSASGELLTLLSPRYQNLPTAIRLSTPPGWDWRHQAHSRQPVTLENNELRGTLWRANLSQAQCWRPGGDRAPGGHSPDALLAAYPLLASQLLEYCMEREVRSSLQLLPGWPPGGRIPRLNLGDAKAELESGVSELIGYGAGLTPDGDDYLLGYLASLWPWQHLGIRPFETVASGNKESASQDDQYQPALSRACAAGALFTVNGSFEDRPHSREFAGGGETFGNQCHEIRLVIWRGLSRRFPARSESAWKDGADRNELILYTD